MSNILRNLCLAAIALLATSASALTPPSDADGPVKLLACVVTSAGVLEASVDSRSDDAMHCEIRCNYELGDRMFSQLLDVTVPARFSGRIGRVDVSNAKPGNYSGEIGRCQKVER